MKKMLLTVIATLLVTNIVIAADFDTKVQLATKRQIYKIQLKTINNSLKQTIEEYSLVMANEKLNASEKQKKMNIIEKKIMELNAQKLELKEQYKKDKKEIKEKAKNDV